MMPLSLLGGFQDPSQNAQRGLLNMAGILPGPGIGVLNGMQPSVSPGSTQRAQPMGTGSLNQGPGFQVQQPDVNAPSVAFRNALLAGGQAAAQAPAYDNVGSSLLSALANGITSGAQTFVATKDAEKDRDAQVARLQAFQQSLNSPELLAKLGPAGMASLQAMAKVDPKGAAKFLADYNLMPLTKFAPGEIGTDNQGNRVAGGNPIAPKLPTNEVELAQLAAAEADPNGPAHRALAMAQAKTPPPPQGLLGDTDWGLAAGIGLPRDASTWDTDQQKLFAAMQRTRLDKMHPGATGAATPKQDPAQKRVDDHTTANQHEITRAIWRLTTAPVPTGPALAWASGDKKFAGMSLATFSAKSDPETRAWLGALREIAQVKLSMMPQGTRAGIAMIESRMKEFINSTRAGYTGSTLEGSILDTQSSLDRLAIPAYDPSGPTAPAAVTPKPGEKPEDYMKRLRAAKGGK